MTFVSEKWGTEYMHLFTCDNFSGKIKEDCDEGELLWIDKTELLSYNLWEGDKIFLNLIKDEGTPFFSLKLCYDENDVLTGHEIYKY